MTNKIRQSNTFIKKIAVLVVLLIITFVTSLTLDANPLSQFLPKHDSSMFQYFGYAISQGRMMYTEIFDHKGPMIFIINHLGTLLTTQRINGIYILEFISIFTYFYFSYKTINLWLNKILSIILIIPHSIILMSFITGGNFTEEYALPFIGISLYIFTKYFKSVEYVNYIEIIFLGFMCAVVFSLRANMVVIWVVFCLVIFIKMLIEKDYRALSIYTISFVWGLLLFFIPVGLYLYRNGALKAAIFQSITFNILYLDQNENAFDAIINLYKTLNNSLIIPIIAAFLIYTVSKWRKITINQKYYYGALILFTAASFFTSILSGRNYNHYLIVMIPTITVPSALLIKELVDNKFKSSLIYTTVVAIVIVYFPQLTRHHEDIYVINTPVEQIDIEEVKQKDGLNDNTKKNHMNRRVINNANKTKQLLEVAQVIKKNSDPSDNIYVHRLAGNLYLLSERLSSIKYFNLPAVDLNQNQRIGEDFITEIQESDTELVVLAKNFNDAEKIGIEKIFFDYVIENYELIYNENNHSIYKQKID